MGSKPKSVSKKVVSPKSNTTPAIPSAAKKIFAGASVALAVLRRMVISFIGLAREHEVAFDERGWPPARTVRLAAAFDLFDHEGIKMGELREAMLSATKETYAARDEGLDLRSQLISALKLVHRGDAAALGRVVALNRVGIKPMAMANWFNAVQPMIKEVHAKLKPHFPTDPLVMVVAQEQRLMKALARQGTLRRRSTDLTAARDAVRSELITGVDQLKLIAGIAFPRNKKLLRGFNKGLEVRRKAAAESTPAEEPAPAPAPAPEAAPQPAKPETAVES